MQEASPARTVPEVLLSAAARFGALTAVEDGETRLTFSELAEAGLQAARGFLASGIAPGDRVGIWAPNVHEWITAALGIQMAGGVLVPLNTRMKGAEASYNLRKSGARLLVSMGDFLGTDYVSLLAGEDLPDLEETIVLRDDVAGTVRWEEFLSRADGVGADVARERAAAVSPDDLSDILFTSGTTGNPKGVMCSHGQTIRCFEVWSEVVGLREGDRYLVVMPFFHSFGYKAGWLSCILRGATVLPQAVFDASEILERVRRDRVSVLPGSPTIYQSFLSHPDRSAYDLSCLRLAVTGAAPTPVELIRQMREDLGFETVVTAYGLTETCGMVSICRPEDSAETIATTCGRAIPDVEVRCVDADGKEVPRGDPGEVVVRGYNVMRGYFEDPDETARTIDADGWLHTGDVAVMDERGYLRITDRIKDMFIMGGFNCYPAEIENLMYAHAEIAQVAVVGVPDDRMGEVGMAFVVLVPEARPTADEIVGWCREHMANYKVPRRVEIVDALPMNASGKVMKFALRERAVAGN